MAITGTEDHTAINCLTHNEWRLDMATDNFYQDPMKYMTEPPRASVDKRKIETLFTKYRSKPHTHTHTHTFTRTHRFGGGG